MLQVNRSKYANLLRQLPMGAGRADALVLAAEARDSSGGLSERWASLAKKAIIDEAKQSQQRADALLGEMRA